MKLRTLSLARLGGDISVKIPPGNNFNKHLPEEKNNSILQLGKGGTPRNATGGLPTPEPPALFCAHCMLLKLALFPSPPRKLLLPSSDRAHRCDSDSPIESSRAQI